VTTLTKTHLPQDQLIPLDDVRTRFAWAWLIGAGLMFLLLVLQSLMHVYADPTGDKTPEVWGWFLPTIMPSLGLIITVLTYTALDPNMTGAVVRKSYVPVAFWLSVVYLATVLLTVLIQPFSAKTAAEAVNMMRTSNLWLGPFQGIVASALGILFVTKEKGK
jgi:hypothetical protein